MHPSAQSADIPWSGQRVIDSKLVRSAASEPLWLEHLTDQVDAPLNVHSHGQLALARPELLAYDRERRRRTGQRVEAALDNSPGVGSTVEFLNLRCAAQLANR